MDDHLAKPISVEALFGLLSATEAQARAPAMLAPEGRSAKAAARG